MTVSLIVAWVLVLRCVVIDMYQCYARRKGRGFGQWVISLFAQSFAKTK